jgi:hypothetical protein
MVKFVRACFPLKSPLRKKVLLAMPHNPGRNRTRDLVAFLFQCLSRQSIEYVCMYVCSGGIKSSVAFYGRKKMLF